MEKSNKLIGIDLCSGIGGITLGLSEYVNPVAYCEIDEYAIVIQIIFLGFKPLQKRLPIS